MPYSGAGAIWAMNFGTFIATNYPGTQVGLDQAKADLVASGGIIQMGAGTEALSIGSTGWGGVNPVAGTTLIRITNIDGFRVSRLHVLDGIDPTKCFGFDMAALTTGIERTLSFPDWSGILPLPIDLGVSGRFLRSNGPSAQPTWAAITLTNALLDGVNHTDTVAQAVARGAIVIGNATPMWDRLPIGAANSLLRSDGTDPSWGTINLLSAFIGDTLAGSVVRGDVIVGNSTPKWARVAVGAANTLFRSDGTDPSWGTVNLLSGFHGDTLAGSPVRGDLILANSTPAWSKLAIGASGTVLFSNGTDASWSANPPLQHDTLNHLKPFSAANCTWTTATNTVSTTGGAFANAKVGDFLHVGTVTVASTQGARITVWTDSNNITVDRTNSGATLSGVTMVVIPGDHWNDTLGVDGTGTGVGLFLTSGRGTYTTLAGGTYQEIRGPIRWMGNADGGLETDFDVRVSNSTSSLSGFCFREQGTTNRAYFYCNDLTGSKVFKFPDINNQFFLLAGGVQNVTDKIFQANNFIEAEATPGAGNGTAFRDPTVTTKRLYFNLTGITGGQDTVATWQDRDGTVAFIDDVLIGNYAPGSFTLANGQYLNHVKQLRLTGSQRATLEGDARMVIAN